MPSSASEKLRALVEAGKSKNAWYTSRLEVMAALPLIADIVEATELGGSVTSNTPKRRWSSHPAIVGKLGWVYCVKKRRQAAEVPTAYGLFCAACEARLGT